MAVSVNNAARYNIHTGEWDVIGTGFNGAVHAIACNGTKVYFGGEFTTADGGAVGYVAQWDEGTETFDDMDTGTSGDVYSLAVDEANDIIYVGGGVFERRVWLDFIPRRCRVG